jgi:magnesium chelatase family protein
MAGLVGGGDPVRPGEVSLSHQGVLFHESLHEFRRNVVDELGRALTASRSRLVRGGKSVSFPASTLVVASAALCPCGSKGAARDTCGCSPERVHAFLDRMKGPVFDRFDVRVVLPADEVGGLKTPPGESSQVVRERVVRARVVQAARARKYGVATVNARLTSAELDLVAAPDLAASRLLANAADRLRLTSEECSRVLRVARTLADLEGRDVVRALHLAEAVLLTAGLREARAR